MSQPVKSPNLDSVTTINRDGSRYFLHPADVRGRFTNWRRVFGVVLIVVYVLLPWIRIGGFPAVFLDVEHRRFHLFGLSFATQDLWMGFFVITGLGFGLFYLTSLLGRLWCGWACPFTVFLDNIYRRIERLIDGDAPARRALDKAPMEGTKVVRRVLKHTLFFLASSLIAHIFLSYFVSIPALWAMLLGRPTEHLLAFGIVTALTLILYGAFSWFREQFCIIMCPYGRIQSALTDDDTVVIGYDSRRGEPRGKAKTSGVGDCVDCRRCVQVCPTGIDIRNGLQLECIGCAACIDACDDIMTKLHRPKGLVRYDSLNGFHGKPHRWIRPRTILYTVMMLVGAGVLTFALSRLRSFNAGITRLPGSPFYIDSSKKVVRNQFQVRLLNKQHEPMSFRLAIEGLPEGSTVAGAAESVKVKPLEEEVAALIVEVPARSYRGHQPIVLRVTSDADGSSLTKSFEFTGPAPELLEQTFKIQEEQARQPKP